MVKIHLSKLLGERKMTQKDLADATGIRASTINEWYHEIVSRLNVEHIDKICEVLDCDITDLLEYIPNAKKKTGKYLILEEHGNRKPKKPKD
ncbi:MAG: helix-turn-helix transcriptional regulator [Ruminococcus sp.]|nr:helix-turn-helix transcriptional regulator [Ruminococcus sp.]